MCDAKGKAMTDIRIPTRRPRAAVALAGALALTGALLVALSPAGPAHATGMKAISGNIQCTAYPNVTVGTSAVARGDVVFQLNAINNTGTLFQTRLGYSSVYAPWSWKFWTTQAGNFYAYGNGSIGNVTSISRWCHGVGA